MVIAEIKDVKKIYTTQANEIHALDGLSLSIKEGEFVAIVGASGSGKSTLLNVLGALDKPTSGEIVDHFREASAYRAGSHPWNFSSRHLYFYNHIFR